MSDETKAAMDEAIAAHFSDEWEGAIVTGYVLQLCGVTSDDIEAGDQTSYMREVHDGQPSHASLGLLNYSHSQLLHAMSEVEE